MANPLTSITSTTGGIGSKAWGALSDTFSGENVDAYNPNKKNFEYTGKGEDYYLGKAGQKIPTVKADLGQYNQSRGMQLQSRGQLDSQMQLLGKLATDPAYSQGATQLKAGQAANFQQSLALARSGGGAAQQAAAMRGAMQANTAANANTNLQAGMVRSQEAQAFAAQRGQLLMQQRAMDLQAAGLDAQTAMQQAQLELGSNQLNVQREMGLYGLSQNAAGMQQKGYMGYEGVKSGNYMAAQLANAQIDAQRDASLVGMAGAVGGGLLAFSDVRGKTEIAPSSTTARAENEYVAALPTTGQRLGGSLMQYGIGQMQGSAQPAAINPSSFLNYQQNLEVSDARAKKLESENAALRDALSGMRAALEAPPPARPMMRSASAPAASAVRAAAYRVTPQAESRPMTAAEQKELDWAIEDADAGKFSEMQGQTMGQWHPGLPRNVEVIPPAYAQNAARVGEQRAAGVAPTVVSDEQAKDVIAAIRQRAHEGEPGGETAAFLQRARERMSGDQEKKLDHALLSAGLDRIEREAVVDGGAPPLQAGRTNVARFDDVPQGVPETVQEAAAVPNFSWRYKPKQAVEKNLKLGLPPTAPQGFARHKTPMAQGMEQNPLYAPAVVTGPDGLKRVDSGTVSMANAGVISDLSRFAQEQEERIRRLEAGRSRVPYPKPREAGL